MKYTITGLLFLFFLSSYGCDNCNVYVGGSPDDDKHSIGLYFRSRHMMGSYNLFGQQTMLKHASHGKDPKLWGNQITEIYNTYELRLKFVLNKRLRTYVFVPITDNRQFIGDALASTNVGIGDPLILQSIHLLDPTQVYENPNFTQRLEIGAGLKIPLGSIDKTVNGALLNLDLQNGSGSWDAVGMIKYMFRIKNIGAFFNATYKWNTFNSERYRYGNTINSNINVFYQTNLNQITLLPTIGISTENAAFDETSEIHLDTGGKVLFVQAGLKCYWKGFMLFGEFQKKVASQNNGYTQLINKYKINAGLAYNF